MGIVFESLLPIFLLMGLGYGLRQINFVEADGWDAMERICFYVLFPAFLALTMYKADFASISFTGLTLTFLVSIIGLMVFGFAIRVPIQRAIGISDASYSSVFQGFCRWNAFIALAIVQKLIGTEALPIAALAIVVMIVPINIGNIFVVTLLGSGSGMKSGVFAKVAKNPMVVGSLVGIFANLTSMPLYEPLQVMLEMLSRTTLPIGLLLVGAGLRIRLPRSSLAACVFSTTMKLLGVPLAFVLTGMAFGVSANEIVIIAICGSVPSAMSGYILARELGGDGPLYASIITLQTLASFFTIPLVLYLAQMVAGT